VRTTNRNVKTYNIKFMDGGTVETTEAEEYLGGVVRRKGVTRREIRRRIGIGCSKISKLQNVWRGTGISVKRKLNIFQATVGAAVLYNLDTLIFNDKERRRLDNAQMRMVRRALHLKPMYLLTEEEGKTKEDQGLRDQYKIKRWSARVDDAQWRVFKQIVSADRDLPLHKCVFDEIDLERGVLDLKDWNLFDESSIPPIPSWGYQAVRGRWVDQITNRRGISLLEAVEEALGLPTGA
jgi:hypothetical protein